MPLQIVRDDLANMRADAIVLPSNEWLVIDGGSGWAVAKEAGLESVQEACDELGGCKVGHAVATHAGSFPARYFIHAVGPVWHGGEQDLDLLQSAYDSALSLTAELECASVAMPLLSAGVFGCPEHVSLSAALTSIRRFLSDCDIEVTLVLFDKDAVAAGLDFLGDIECRIDDAYAQRRAEEEGQNIGLSFGVGEWGGAQAGHPWHQGVSSGSVQRAPESALYPPEDARRPLESARSSSHLPHSSEKRRRKKDGSPFDRFTKRRRERKKYKEEMIDALREEPSDDRREAPSDGVFGAASADELFGAPAAAPSVPEDSLFGAPSVGVPAIAPKPESDLPEAPLIASESVKETRFLSHELQEASSDMMAAAPAAAPAAQTMPAAAPFMAGQADDLESRLGALDEGFSQTLLRYIDCSGMTDAQVYRRANMTRQHFSKIRSNVGYQPKKPTVVALCVALELDIAQTRDLLARAGFALSHASKFDIIVEYFIERGIFDLYKINETLFYFDQQILG